MKKDELNKYVEMDVEITFTDNEICRGTLLHVQQGKKLYYTIRNYTQDFFGNTYNLVFCAYQVKKVKVL